MKINSEYILLKPEDYSKKIKIFLITGNEDTLIDKISELLISSSKKNYLQNVIRLENQSIKKNSNELFEDSLFKESKIVVHSNPKDVDLECLIKVEERDLILIIKDNKMKNSSKVKKFFESHPEYGSITCYK